MNWQFIEYRGQIIAVHPLHPAMRFNWVTEEFDLLVPVGRVD